VVWSILKNPAYKGTAAFGKTRTGPLRPRLRAPRHRDHLFHAIVITHSTAS